PCRAAGAGRAARAERSRARRAPQRSRQPGLGALPRFVGEPARLGDALLELGEPILGLPELSHVAQAQLALRAAFLQHLELLRGALLRRLDLRVIAAELVGPRVVRA